MQSRRTHGGTGPHTIGPEHGSCKVFAAAPPAGAHIVGHRGAVAAFLLHPNCYVPGPQIADTGVDSANETPMLRVPPGTSRRRIHPIKAPMIEAIARAARLAAVVLALVWALPGGAWAQQASTDPLRPGDLIRLKIWREPDLSGEFRVDDEGVAILPRLGPTQVGGQEPAALTARLVAAYADFLQHRSIEVVLLRRIQVLGAVRNPGIYSVEPTMTVSDALALAGGTTSEGNPKRIDLIRGGRRLPVALSAETRLAATSIRSGDQLFVPERGWLTRNTGIVTAAITGTVSLLIALLR